MSPQDIRETLIARTIEVISSQGLDKTTTKAITTGTGINEAYIYRCFSDKDDLLSKAFEKLDNELYEVAMRYVSVMYESGTECELRCRRYFEAVWYFLLGNRGRCLAFVQYYYSPYFEKYSAEDHMRRYAPLVDEIQEVFKDEANVWMILTHILNVMLGFAVKVHNGQMPKDDDYPEHVFRVVYRAVEQYFKKSEESDL